MATQIKNIPLKGLATSPSDFTCEDGVSAMALNMLRKDGSFVGAIHSAPVLIEDTDGAEIIFQHRKNFIYHRDGVYYWKKNDPSELGVPIEQIASVSRRIVHNVSSSAIIRYDTPEGQYSYQDVGGEFIINPFADVTLTPEVHVFVDNREVSVPVTLIRKCFVRDNDDDDYQNWTDLSTDTPVVHPITDAAIQQSSYGAGRYYWVYKVKINGRFYYKTIGCVCNFEDACDTVEVGGSSTGLYDSGWDDDEVTMSWSYDNGSDSYSGTQVIQVTGIEFLVQTIEKEIEGTNITFGTLYYSKATDYLYSSYSEWTPLPDSYEEETTDTRYFSALEGVEIKEVAALGNILILYSSSEQYFYSYVSNEDTETDFPYYKYLGNGLPQIDMRFTLDGHFFSNHVKNSSNPKILDLKNDGDVDEFAIDALKKANLCTKLLEVHDINDDSEKYQEFLQGVLGEANLFTKLTAEKGYFTQPFLVRFALRMHDGTTYTMASAPILMMPTNSCNPINFVAHTSIHDTWGTAYIAAQGIACKLRYIISDESIQMLNNWKGLIDSVDVFVSKPVYTYDQDSKIVPDFIDITRYDGPGDPDSDELDPRDCWPAPITGQDAVFQIGDNAPKRYKDYVSMIKDLKKAYGKTSAQKIVIEGRLKPIDHPNGDYLEFSTVVGSADHSWGYNCGYDHESDGSGKRTYSRIQWYFGRTLYNSIGLPYRSALDIAKELNETSLFFKVAEIPIDKLKSSQYGIELEIPQGRLVDVSTNEALTEDYDSWHKLIPSRLRVYNSRLHKANITKYYFDGFPLDMMAQVDGATDMSYYVAAVYITDDIHDIVKCSMSRNKMAIPPAVQYLYYPDAKAIAIELYYKDGHTIKYKRYQLKPHPMLNGSYYMPDTIGLEGDAATLNTNYASLEAVMEELSADNTGLLRNSIYTSEVNNPFSYKAANVTTVGRGEVFALAPQTQALSEGQFGVHPMLAFTDDGIWALSVNQTGGFSAVQPISRDVLLGGKPTNILQLDQQILFCSERGLMSITGSSVECISERFDGDTDKFRLRLAGEWHDAHAWIMDNVASGAKVSALELYITDEREDTGGTTEKRLLLDTPFKDVIKDAVLLYDYRHSRVIVGWRDKPLAYVLDLKDGEWTTIVQRITSAINSYPDCYAMTSVLRDDVEHFWTDTKCVDFSAESAVEHYGFDPDVYMPFPGLYMTRTLSLGDSTALKVIRTLNVQGRFANSHVGIILLGSNDNAMNDWVVLASVVGGRMAFRNGTPMKHFRLLIPCQLAKGEDVSSVTVEFEVKEPQNKLRQ